MIPFFFCRDFTTKTRCFTLFIAVHAVIAMMFVTKLTLRPRQVFSTRGTASTVQGHRQYNPGVLQVYNLELDSSKLVKVKVRDSGCKHTLLQPVVPNLFLVTHPFSIIIKLTDPTFL